MITFILLILGVILIVFFVNSYQNKYQSFQGVVFNTIVVILLLFFLISITYVYRSNDVELTSFKGITNFSKVYFSWLGSIFRTTGNVVGYTVEQDWGGNYTGSK